MLAALLASLLSFALGCICGALGYVVLFGD